MTAVADEGPGRGVLGRIRRHPERSTWYAIGALILVGTLIRVPQLFHNLAEAYAFRQTQTAFVVRQYAQNGIDLFHTPLPVFGPNSDVPMEFPLFQATASLFVHVGLTASEASRTLGLIGFIGTAILLAVLLRRWHGRAVAIVAVGLLEFLPFGLLWGAASLIDFVSVALSLLMVVGLEGWFSRRPHAGWYLAAGVVGGVLAFPVKVTTAPVYGVLVLVSAIVAIRDSTWRRSWKRIVVGLAAAPGAGFLLAVAWTVFGDRIKSQDPLTVFLTSSSLRAWNFGTLTQRADPANYGVIFGRISSEIAGPAVAGLLLAVVALIFVRNSRQRLLLGGWLVTAILAPLVFFNLYVVHDYYLIAIYPAIVSAMAVGLVWFLRAIPGTFRQRAAVAVVATLGLLLSLVLTPGGRSDLGQFATNNPIPAVSSLLLDQTKPSDQIVMIGCDWDPTFLFYGQRTGLMFRGSDAGDTWSRQDIGDYEYLFSCNKKLDPADYLPAGYIAEPLTSGGFFAIKKN